MGNLFSNYDHVKLRALQRHNIRLTINDIKELERNIQSRKAILLAKTSTGCSVYKVHYNNIELIIYYKQRHIRTILPKNNRYE